MSIRTVVARLVLLAIVVTTFCVSSTPASATINATYSFTVNCNTVHAVIAGLRQFEEEIQEFAAANQNNTYVQEEAAEWVAGVETQISNIEKRYSSCGPY